MCVSVCLISLIVFVHVWCENFICMSTCVHAAIFFGCDCASVCVYVNSAVYLMCVEDVFSFCSIGTYQCLYKFCRLCLMCMQVVCVYVWPCV